MLPKHFRSKRHPGQIATVSLLLACMWFSPFQINKQLYFCWIFCTKRTPAAILDDRKSLSIAFLVISDQYATFIFVWFFWHKIAAAGYFGWAKITFDHISRHLRSNTQPLFLLIFGKSLLIALLAISDQYATFIFLEFFAQNGHRRPFWMTENHFRSHFSPFQINTQLLIFLNFLHKMATGSHFGWPKITFDRISRHLISIHNLYFCWHKMAAGWNFGRPKINFDRISRHFRSMRNFCF